jgi:GMP synthase-like glutamine amidotransferase
VRILSITHGHSVPGGLFDEVAEADGHALERWSVPHGAAPRALGEYDALMVFGGSMHPDQDEHFPWLEREAEVLHDALEQNIPVIGVCLGAQLLARAAEAGVRPASAPEIGWFEVELTSEGRDDPVLGVLSPETRAFQWHHYTFETPAGGTELARSDVCTQAFRLGNALGVQFHAEVTQPMIEAWLVEDPDDVPDPEALLADTREWIGAWNEQGRRLCEAFLKTAL